VSIVASSLPTSVGFTRVDASSVYALIAGAAAAALVIAILHAEHKRLGHASPATLLYGVTVGPIIEEILFRGAAFSVIYVTAGSINGLLGLRLAIAIVLLPCSSRSPTPGRWEFPGLCSLEWAHWHAFVPTFRTARFRCCQG
jgi:hypothetical protein